MRPVVLIVLLAGAPAVAAPPAPPAPPPPMASPIARRLHPDTITASSFRAHWTDHHPSYVADDDPATAWVEDGRRSGAGTWLRLGVTPLAHTTRIRLRIRNGCQASRERFHANARAREVTVRLLRPLQDPGVDVRPDEPIARHTHVVLDRQVTLDDTYGWQDVAIEHASDEVATVELAITSVYPGATSEDLCISDVQVFATSRTPDNPVVEKHKRESLRQWRATRLVGARLSQTRGLPLYPAYEITTSHAELKGGRGDRYDIADMIGFANNDPSFQDWKGALAVAAATAAGFDQMVSARIVPAAPDRLVAPDGLDITRIHNLIDPDAYGYHHDEAALRLPMLDHISTMFADQLRVYEVEDGRPIERFLADHTRCKGDITWVKRRPAKEHGGRGRVQAIVVGRCMPTPVRERVLDLRQIELYVYDPTGRLVLSVGNGHIDAYRWIEDRGRPMLAGGVALLWTEKRIEANKRDAVPRIGRSPADGAR